MGNALDGIMIQSAESCRDTTVIQLISRQFLQKQLPFVLSSGCLVSVTYNHRNKILIGFCLGIRFAFHMMSKGLWTKKQVRKFLATMAVSKSRQNLIAEVKVGDEFDEDEYIPYLWYSKYFKPVKFIKTDMHLLGHGIVGSLVELLEKVFTDHKLWTKFVDFANEIIVDVASFCLDWCKVKLLLKANWLGEDCFGFGRLLLYVVTQFLSKYDLEEIREDTTKE